MAALFVNTHSMISFQEFQDVDLRVGTIREAEVIEESEKLLRLEVDIGEKTRQIIAGIKRHVAEVDELVGIEVVVVANLEPAELFGFESQGMLLAAQDDAGLSVISPRSDVANGASVQ